MRLIDADALKRKAQKVATEAWKMRIKSSVETMLNQFIDWIDAQPTIEPEPQIIYSKAGYIMSLHKEYGCTLIRAEEAHNKALEYLRDKAMMKG